MPAERRGQVTCAEIDLGQLATEGTRRFWRKAAAFGGGTSRMSREAQVRICERLGVQLPGATRRLWWRPTRSRNSRPELIATDGQGMFFPACPIAWQRPDRKAGHAPGVKRSEDTSG